MKKIVTLIIPLLIIIPIVSIDAQTLDYELEKYLPSYFNWRDINGIDYTTPIKDQSPAPTCESYALCASLETIMQYQIGELYGPDLSEAHLYFYPGGTIEQGYVNIIDAVNYLIEYGVPDEGCFPDPHRNFDTPFESLEGWENRTVKITDWGWVDKDNIENMKSSLINYGPLVMCFRFPQDFYSYKSGVYRPSGDPYVGGHVVTIVGYDDSKECWIVKNSWGAKWGDEGWFKLAYDANMFAEWYGEDTGVMYLDGIYGNLQPDVPKISIEKPTIKHTYFFGIELPIILRFLNIQAAAPRLIGSLYVAIKAENTNKVEFYVDNELKFTDEEEPFKWRLKTSPGLHTIDILAYNNQNLSKDIVDVFVFF